MFTAFVQWLKRLFSRDTPLLTDSGPTSIVAVGDVPMTLSGSVTGELLLSVRGKPTKKRVSHAAEEANANALLRSDDARESVVVEVCYQAIKRAEVSGYDMAHGSDALRPFVAKHVSRAIESMAPKLLRGPGNTGWQFPLAGCASKVLETLRDGRHHDRVMAVQVGPGAVAMMVAVRAHPGAGRPNPHAEDARQLVRDLALAAHPSLPDAMVGAIGIFLLVGEAVPATEANQEDPPCAGSVAELARAGIVQGEPMELARRHGVTVHAAIAWEPGLMAPESLSNGLAPASWTLPAAPGRKQDEVVPPPDERQEDQTAAAQPVSALELADGVSRCLHDDWASDGNPLSAVFRALGALLGEEGRDTVAAVAAAAALTAARGGRGTEEDTLTAGGLTVRVVGVGLPGVSNYRARIQPRIANDIERAGRQGADLAVLVYGLVGTADEGCAGRLKVLQNVVAVPTSTRIESIPPALRAFAVYTDLLPADLRRELGLPDLELPPEPDVRTTGGDDRNPLRHALRSAVPAHAPAPTRRKAVASMVADRLAPALASGETRAQFDVESSGVSAHVVYRDGSLDQMRAWLNDEYAHRAGKPVPRRALQGEDVPPSFYRRGAALKNLALQRFYFANKEEEGDRACGVLFLVGRASGELWCRAAVYPLSPTASMKHGIWPFDLLTPTERKDGPADEFRELASTMTSALRQMNQLMSLLGPDAAEQMMASMSKPG